MTISIVLFSFLTIGLVGTYAVKSMVQKFISMVQLRNEEFEETLGRNSDQSKNRFVAFFEEATRLKGESLIKKDSLLLRNPFLDNSFSLVRDALQNSFDFDPSILSASFIVVEDDSIKAWQHIDREHPAGLGIPITYDRKLGAWRSLAKGQAVVVKDPQVQDIVQLNEATIRKIEVTLSDAKGSRVVPAYEATIPIFDGDLKDIAAARKKGEIIAYLRYVISIEQLTLAIATEEKALAVLKSTQMRSSANALSKTLRSVQYQLSRTTTILLLTAIVVIIIGILVSMYLSHVLSEPLNTLSRAADLIAKGDYSRSVSLTSDDEIGHLGRSFDSMRLQVKNFTERLQDLVDERTAKLKMALKTVTEQSQKIREIMSHIDQGILTVDADLNIESEYSQHLTSLYRHIPGSLAGMPMEKLIFPGSSIKSDAQHTIREILLCAIGMDSINWEVNSGNLPRRIQYQDGESSRTFEFQWSPILDGDTMGRLLITVRDLTHELEMEAKLKLATESTNKLSQTIGVMLSTRQQSAVLMLKDAHRRLEEVETFLKNPVNFKQAYIHLHTMKGAARAVGFKEIAQLIHESEFFLHHQAQTSHYDAAGFEAAVHAIRSELDYTRDVATRILNLDLGEGPQHAQNLLVLLADEFREAERLCQLHNMNVGEIIVEDQLFTWDAVLLSDFIQAARLAITNSLDHGYFHPMEKGLIPPDEKVMLAISILRSDEFVQFIFRDQGYGFDREALRILAKEKGIEFDPTSHDIKDLLLEKLSTARSVSQLSGHGTGLSAIQNFASKWQGDIQFTDNRPRGTCITITLPISAVTGGGSVPDRNAS